MTIEKFDKFFHSGYDYTAILKKRFEDEKIKSSVAGDHYYLIYQYQWLSTKFKIFDTDEMLIEDYIRKEIAVDAVFSYFDFEMLIQSVMYLIFNDAYKLTMASYDNGIDLECNDEFSFDGKTIFGQGKKIVQCKYYKGYIPVNEIREFYGVMNSEISVGYFYTTGRFTKSGLDFISKIQKAPFANHIYLIDGKKLKKILDILDQITCIIEDTETDNNCIDSIIEKAKNIINQPIHSSFKQGELFI